MFKRSVPWVVSSTVAFMGWGLYWASSQNAVAQASPLFAQCQGCHQATGLGLPGVFPPLAGHIPEVLEIKGGKEYLISVLLHGLQGAIEVKGAKFNGAMPSYAHLKDEEIAAVLTHISTQWGNKLPKDVSFTAQDVKAQRASRMTPAQVLELRKKLGVK